MAKANKDESNHGKIKIFFKKVFNEVHCHAAF